MAKPITKQPLTAYQLDYNRLMKRISSLPIGAAFTVPSIFSASHTTVNPKLARQLREEVLSGKEKRLEMVGTRCSDGFRRVR